MKPYILLTPGPLTTSETVKEAMLTDWCTWDADYNVHIVEEIRKSLVALATKQTDEYTSVLLQGSGTYCVEAVIGSTVKPGDKLLILSNGAYGDRMGNIAEYHGINYDMLAFDETEQVSVSYVNDYLAQCGDYTCIGGTLRNHYRRAEPVEGDSPHRKDARKEADCRCYEQLWRSAFGCRGTGY